MQRLELNAADLSRISVRASWGPLTEALFSLRLLRGPRLPTRHEGWRERVRDRIGPDAARLFVLAPDHPTVDLHTVVGETTSMDEALDRLGGAPDEQIATELAPLRASTGSGRIPEHSWLRGLARGDRDARRDLVERLRAYHLGAVSPHWAALQAYLEAERARRARVMADGGVERLLTTLHPRVRWRPPVLEVGAGGGDGGRTPHPPVVLGGRSVVLVPAVFCLEPVVLASSADEAMPYVLVYPAVQDVADAAALWHPEPSPASAALARVLGRTRAAALEVIAETCTTTELAQRVGVSPATASHHAGVLRAAGLVTTRRTGSNVTHGLSALGAELLDGPSGRAPTDPHPVGGPGGRSGP